MITERWAIRPDGFLTPASEDCLEAAVAAPSVHNTQPWKFRIRGSGIDVYADYSRRLDVIDPHGRELLISVGAAVLNLRVAILAHGHQPLLRLLPSVRERNLVARVTPGPPVQANQTARALAQAVPRRRTNRRPFADIPVPEHTLDELAAAAKVEGATLSVADSIERDWLFGLTIAADRRFRDQPGYWAELGSGPSPRPNAGTAYRHRPSGRGAPWRASRSATSVWSIQRASAGRWPSNASRRWWSCARSATGPPRGCAPARLWNA